MKVLRLWNRMPYRSVIFFLAFYEMFQKFATFGFQSVLFLFLKHELKYTLYDSIGVYHVYVGVSYLVPVIGTCITDHYVTKQVTAMFSSLVAVLGHIVLMMVSVAASEAKKQNMALVMDNVGLFLGYGLFLRAVGIGTVRQVISSMGDDHFHDPNVKKDLNLEQKKLSKRIVHYFIVVGMVLAFIVPPALRMSAPCYGNPYCFPLAFGAPLMGTVMAVVVLMAGYGIMYFPIMHASMTMEFFRCIQAALNNFRAGGAHWIDNASYAYEDRFLDDVKLVLHVLPLFVPLPMFWALFEQMGSQWVAQGTQMNTTLNNVDETYMEPEQMLAFNPLFVLVLLPIVEHMAIPFFTKVRCCVIRTPKQFMFIGAMMAAFAFMAAAYLEYQIEPTRPPKPRPGTGDVLLVNMFDGFNMTYTVTFSKDDETVYFADVLSMLYIRGLPVVGTRPMNVSVYWPTDEYCTQNGVTKSDEDPAMLRLLEEKIVTVSVSPVIFITSPCRQMENLNFDMIYSTFERCDLQMAKVGVVYHSRRIFGTTLDKQEHHYPRAFMMTMFDIRDHRYYFQKFMDPNHSGLDFFHVRPGLYERSSPPKNITLDVQCKFRRNGVYMIMSKAGNVKRYFSLLDPFEKRVSIWWQVFQYFLISFGEYLFPLMLLEYALAQTTERMKSVVWNCWLFTIALGNFIVAILSFSHIFQRQLHYYLLYAFLMGVDCLLLIVMLCSYVQLDARGLPGEPEYRHSPYDTLPSTKSSTKSSDKSSMKFSSSRSSSRSSGRSSSRSSSRSSGKSVTFG